MLLSRRGESFATQDSWFGEPNQESGSMHRNRAESDTAELLLRGLRN